MSNSQLRSQILGWGSEINMSLSYPLLNRGWSFSNPVHSLENHWFCSTLRVVVLTEPAPSLTASWMQLLGTDLLSCKSPPSAELPPPWDLWTLSIQEHSPEEGSGGERNKNLGWGYKSPRTTKGATRQQKNIGNGFINVPLPRLFLIAYTTFLCYKGVVRFDEIMSPLEYFPRENARQIGTVSFPWASI